MTVPAGCPLTSRQVEIVAVIANGGNQNDAAQKFGVTPSTVHSHLSTAYRRLGVSNSAQAALRCWREGWIKLAGVSSPASMLAPDQGEGRRNGLIIRPAHQCYLWAFDAYLAARTPDEKRAARMLMDRAAGEAGIPTGRSDKGRPELVDMLIGYVRRERAARRVAA